MAEQESLDTATCTDTVARMSWRTRIEVNPEILVGKPIIKGTRLAVEFVLDLVAAGCPEDEILRNYPGLSHDDILALFPKCVSGGVPCI